MGKGNIFFPRRIQAAETDDANKARSQEVFVGLRDLALSAKAADFPEKAGKHGVYGALMEMRRSEGAVVTLVTFMSGDASLYFSNGGGMIGGIGHEAARKAEELGAEFYDPRKKIGKLAGQIDFKKALRNNYQWLRRKVKQGYEVIDIGFDRARKGGRGIFYRAEKNWLKLWGKK